MKAKLTKNLTYWLGVVVLGLVVGVSIQFVTAWTEPVSAPPGGNVGAPINTSALLQTKLGNFVAQNLGAYNLTLVQKGSSASTIAADPGTTLVTKDYVDAQAGGGSWIFLADSDDTRSATATATVQCPTGMTIVGYTGNRTCGTGLNPCGAGNPELGSINNYAPISGGTSFCSSQSCTAVTLGTSTSLTCTATRRLTDSSYNACAEVAVICSK